MKEKYAYLLYVLGLVAVIYSLKWDIWWHGIEGYEQFFQMTHNAIYVGGTISILSAIAMVIHTRSRVWMYNLFLLFLFAPAAAFNWMYHENLGVGEPTDLAHILWEPPHIIFTLLLMLIFLGVIFQTIHRSGHIYIFVKIMSLSMIVHLLSAISEPLLLGASATGLHILEISFTPFFMIGIFLYAREILDTKMWRLLFVILTMIPFFVAGYYYAPVFLERPPIESMLATLLVLLSGVYIAVSSVRNTAALGVVTGLLWSSMALFYVRDYSLLVLTPLFGGIFAFSIPTVFHALYAVYTKKEA